MKSTEVKNSTSPAIAGNNVLPAVKELACWIYYEDGSIFYCFDCVEKRMDEINKNREFADDIDYEGGDTCGYWQDYADTEGSHEAECCQCHKPLFTLGFVAFAGNGSVLGEGWDKIPF